MQDYSCPGVTFASCSGMEKRYLGKASYPVTHLSKSPRGNEKLMWTVTGTRPCTEARLTPRSVSCPGAMSCPGIMWTGPKLHHLKIVPKFSICKKFYRKALPFETNSFQSLANFNVKKNENVCVVVPLMDNIKYCCYISIKKFAICDI